MKFLDDHLIGGFVLGVIIGMKYGVGLTNVFPFLVIVGVIFLLRYIRAK